MEIYEVVSEIAEYKKNDDFEGFKIFIESLDFDQLIRLKSFSKELELFCDNQLSKYFE